jgi:hypothetical protein
MFKETDYPFVAAFTMRRALLVIYPSVGLQASAGSASHITLNRTRMAWL